MPQHPLLTRFPVHAQRPDGHRAIQPLRTSRCSSRSTRSKSRRASDRDRRPGSRQERAEHVRIVDREHRAEVRHERARAGWCQRSRSASRSRSYSPFCSAWTSDSTRCRLKTASFRDIVGDNAARAFEVARPERAWPRSSARSSGHAHRKRARARLPPKPSGEGGTRRPMSCRRAAPPRRCRHALRATSRPRAVSIPEAGAVTRSKMRKPATVAAALLPSPAAIGMSLSTSTNTVGAGTLA